MHAMQNHTPIISQAHRQVLSFGYFVFSAPEIGESGSFFLAGYIEVGQSLSFVVSIWQVSYLWLQQQMLQPSSCRHTTGERVANSGICLVTGCRSFGESSPTFRSLWAAEPLAGHLGPPSHGSQHNQVFKPAKKKRRYQAHSGSTAPIQGLGPTGGMWNL